MNTQVKPSFDLATAQEMVDSFSMSNGLGCRLLSDRGEVLYQQGIGTDECRFLKALPGEPPVCEGIHLKGMYQSERFGGRYIYACPSGLTYFAAPILIGGIVAGALIAGPVLMTELDDHLDDLISTRGVPAGGVSTVRCFLADLPQVAPARLSHLSTQLFANAVYIGDSSNALLLRRDESRQQNSIGEYVQQLKTDSGTVPYPVEKEQELTAAISQGDKATAAALLNEVLGHIFFFTPDPDTIQARVAELLVLLSRAAIYGGGDTEAILDLNYRYMQKLRLLRSQEEVAQWLAKVLNRYTDLVFELMDSKHKNVIRKAVGYMKASFTQRLTLGDVADYVGYSHSHFSKVFKDEMGCGFRTYLNQLRVEKSKALLLSGTASIAEICDACGFEDQSYFCKVFKKMEGVTPDKYRKQSRRIDISREYGLQR